MCDYIVMYNNIGNVDSSSTAARATLSALITLRFASIIIIYHNVNTD